MRKIIFKKKKKIKNFKYKKEGDRMPLLQKIEMKEKEKDKRKEIKNKNRDKNYLMIK